MSHSTPSSLLPGIARATLLISLDNGGINRARSEDEQRQDLDRFLDVRTEDLGAIDAWLSSLTDEQMETACCGEHTEMLRLMATAPAGTNKLLNDYFEGPC